MLTIYIPKITVFLSKALHSTFAPLQISSWSREHIKRRRQLIVKPLRVGGFLEGPIAADMQSGRGTFYFKSSRVRLFLSAVGSLITSSHLS